VTAGSVEEMICKDEGLSALDRKLAEVYAAASKKPHESTFEAEQRGWLKGRDECLKSDDKRQCVRQEYERRIVELQIGFALVPGTAPVKYKCDDNTEVVATYFKTDPPALIARRGEEVSLMFLQPSGSGAKYQGRNEMLWEHGGEALVRWGHGAKDVSCKKAAPPP
jgi:uncharacterized protein